MMLESGTQLSHYQIRSRSGTGGMGEVYRAMDLKLNREVAIKVLRQECESDPSRLKRFEQEARAASALNHPNIVTIYDIQSAEGFRFIVMEWVLGRTFREVASESLPLESILRWNRQVAEALGVAHDAGIVHRDIKPENIMVRHDGYVKLLDFGLARLLTTVGKEFPETHEQTLPGVLIGTAKYMSPEQVRGEPAESASDIFSLGTVIYELSTGHHPFAAQHLVGTLHAIHTQTPVAPTRLRNALPEAFESLVMQMLDKDPALRPEARQVEAELGRLVGLGLSVAVPGPATGLARRTVGRTLEIEELKKDFQALVAGQSALICVAGEAGIGKTTLVESFLDDAAASRQPVAIGRGRCTERFAGTEAYQPFLEALDSLLQHDSRESASGVMKTVAPMWYSEVRPSGGLVSVPAISQERLKREVCAFFREFSKRQPLILFFDDLHWADASTVDLLAFLAARFDTMRILFVATYRPEELKSTGHSFNQVKLELQAHNLCRETRVGFLTSGDIREYLSLEFPRNRFLDDFAELLFEKTEGNPFFMVELVNELRDRQVIAQEDGVWILHQAVSELGRDLPASIRSMIERKIGGLTDDGLATLTAASVQGHEFDSSVVARALEIDPAEIEEQLAGLGRTSSFIQLLGEDGLPNGAITVQYRFIHILYQNALYNRLAPTRRASLSRKVADALLSFHGEKNPAMASRVALLLESARDFERAAVYFLRAARHASRVFAYRERAVLAGRGLKMLRMIGGSTERKRREVSLLVTRGPALMATKGWAAPDVEETYTRALELSRQLEGHPGLFQTLWGLFSVRLVRAEFQDAERLCQELLQLGEASEEASLRSQAHLAFGETLFYLGQLSGALEHLKLAGARSETTARHSVSFTLWQDVAWRAYSVWALCLLGFPQKALEVSGEVLSMVEERNLSHPFSLAYAYWSATALHQFLQQPEETRHWAEQAVELCEEQELASFWGWGSIPLGWALTKLDHIEEGADRIRRGLEEYRGSGSELASTYFLGLLAEVCGDTGAIEDGLRYIAEALTLAEETGERFFQSELHRLRGELLRLDGGEAAEAEASFRNALEIARRQGAKWFELRATTSLSRLWLDEGRQVEARKILTEMCGWFEEGAETVDLRRASALLQSLS